MPDQYRGFRMMRIVSIDKVGNTVYGCIDDGAYYHIFTADSDNPVTFERKFDRDNYSDYGHFVMSYSTLDPCCMFLEDPVEIEATTIEELSYEYLLFTWERIWGL
jgi:hypothetical protein